MQQLKLRTVGVRHVVSDGNNDLGELPEAHLKTYVASLPGANYAIPNSSSAAAMSQGRRGANVRTFSKGEAQRDFNQSVEARKQKLLSQDSDLTELEATRLAAAQVAKTDPELLAAYRKDVEKP